jgi:hypothetical protein
MYFTSESWVSQKSRYLERELHPQNIFSSSRQCDRKMGKVFGSHKMENSAVLSNLAKPQA